MKTNILKINRVLGIILVCLTVFSGNAWGAASTASFIWSTSGQTMTTTSGTIGKIDLTSAKNSAGSDPAVSSNQLRLYTDNTNGNGGSVTVTAQSGYQITGVTINSTTNGDLAYKINSGSYTSKAWTGSSPYSASLTSLSANSVTFQNQNKSGTHIRITSLVVTYELSGYAVTYDNGGRGTAPSNTTAISVTLSAITGVTGYTCSGWTANVAVTVGGDSKSAGTLLSNGSTATLSQATTFTAQWSANNYTVTLNDNGGSGGSGSKSVTYNASTNLTSSVTVPTKAYHDFAGYWTSTDGGSTFGTQLVNADGSWKASVSTYTDASKNWIKADNVTLYAKWTEKVYTNYRTTCCLKLSTIGGTVTINNPVSVDLTWDMIDHVDSWTVEYKEHSDDDWTTAFSEKTSSDSEISEIDSDDDDEADTYKSTITGLSCNTAYDFRITANPATDYCEKVEVLDNSGSGYNTGKWDVAYTLTDDHVEKTAGPDAGENVCGDFEATFEAEDGYILPSIITVTIGGASATAGTDYTWTKATGVLAIDAEKITGDLAITITGEEKSCNANPTIGDPSLVSITSGTITVSCPSIGSGTGCEVSDYGFYYVSGGDDPTTSDTKAQVGTDDRSTAFEKAISISFTTGTTYKFKAYASNDRPATTLSTTSLTVVPRSITFDSKGGSSVTTQYVNSGTATSTPTAPTKTGYTFSKWQLSGEDYDFSSNVSSNITLDAVWTANSYAVTLNANGGVGDDQTVSATYNAAMPTKTTSEAAIVLPTKEGYTFTGYWDATSGGNKYYNANGTSAASWNYATTKTLYAQWTINSYKVSVASVDNVIISSTTPSAAEGANNTANYNSTVTLSYSSVASGKYWGGWNVYKDGDESVKVTVTNNQFTLPAYDVVVSAFLYGDLKAWCMPEDLTFKGDVYLTSTAGVYVHTTETTDNLLNISCDDLGSATTIEVAYLDADNSDTEVAKASSVFLLYESDASAEVDEIDVSADRELAEDYSIRYQPTTAGVTHNYKLQLTLKNGDIEMGTQKYAIHGRSLPNGFVIAVKNDNDDKWYALPSNLAGTKEGQSDIVLSGALQIDVDDDDDPTEALLVPQARIYYGLGRATAGSNVYGIRFTSDGTNGTTKLRAASDAGKVWLPTANADANQVWNLASSDLTTYTVTMPTINTTNKLGIYEDTKDKFGYTASSHASDIYFLPVGSTVDELTANVSEWSQYDILVEANAGSVSATQVYGELSGDEKTKFAIPAPVSTNTYLLKLGDDIDFAGKAGDVLTLKWYDESNDQVAVSWVTVPSIIAAGSTATWSALASAPTINDIVVLDHPMTVNGAAKAKRIVIDKSGSNTGKLTVNAGEGLVIAETIKKYNGTGFVATGEEDIKLLSDGTNGTGALAVGEESTDTKATVQFYTKANANDGWVNQYFGIPVEETSGLAYYGAYLYEFDAEAFRWNNITSEKLQAFHPYRILRREKTTTTFEIGGTLVLPGTTTHKDKVLNLFRDEADYNETDPSTKEPYNTINIYSNSWAAPIAITAFEDGDFVNVEKTIYIFNAGTVAQAEAQGSFGAKDDTPGQWLSLPISTVKDNPSNYLTVIPSQQAFLVYATGTPNEEDGHHLKLDYKKLVYDPAVAGTAAIVPNRAPRREAEEEMVMMCLKVEGESGYRDRVMIHMRSDFSQGFDNGWDGSKIEGNATAPQMYAITEGGYMSVNCVPTAEGTVIAFKTGSEDSNYNFTFDYDGEEVWYLNDLQEQESTMIDAAHSYQFSSTTNDNKARFVISKSPIHKVTTGVEGTGNDPEVHKLLIEDKLFIIRGGHMYSADGALVK